MSDDCTNSLSCPCAPVFTVQLPNPPPPPTTFYNTQQCATASCPSGQAGSPVTKCVSANTFSSSVSQLDADNLAYAEALRQATADLNCGLAGQLNGLLWLMPCVSGGNPCNCSDPSDQVATAQGNPAQTYLVQLRIRGVVELKPYTLDGVAGTANSYVFTCSNTSQSIPAAPGQATNEYALVISDPPATLFLNNNPANIVPSASVAVDYQVSVHIKTGATVTLKARSIDTLEFRNVGNIISNNAPPAITPTEPYSGQYIQMDVLSIQ